MTFSASAFSAAQAAFEARTPCEDERPRCDVCDRTLPLCDEGYFLDCPTCTAYGDGDDAEYGEGDDFALFDDLPF